METARTQPDSDEPSEGSSLSPQQKEASAAGNADASKPRGIVTNSNRDLL